MLSEALAAWNLCNEALPVDSLSLWLAHLCAQGFTVSVTLHSARVTTYAMVNS